MLQLTKKLVFEERWKVIGMVTFHIRIKHNSNKDSVQKKIPVSLKHEIALHNATASDVDSLHNLA